MLNRLHLLAGLSLSLVLISGAQAEALERRPFDAKAFAAEQAAGRPILVEVSAVWCPICKAQKPILSDLTAQPKFADLKIFYVDFDGQKDVVKGFNAQMQSTLITFHGKTETGRSVGDTERSSISALLDKAI